MYYDYIVTIIIILYLTNCHSVASMILQFIALAVLLLLLLLLRLPVKHNLEWPFCLASRTSTIDSINEFNFILCFCSNQIRNEIKWWNSRAHQFSEIFGISDEKKHEFYCCVASDCTDRQQSESRELHSSISSQNRQILFAVFFHFRLVVMS